MGVAFLCYSDVTNDLYQTTIVIFPTAIRKGGNSMSITTLKTLKYF